MGIIVNKPLENLQIEGILEKLKITPEERDPAIRLDKPVMLGGPLAHASDAPGRGWHWGLEAVHQEFPRGHRTRVGTVGPLEEVLTDRSFSRAYQTPLRLRTVDGRHTAFAARP